jgi:hypothetical protein
MYMYMAENLSHIKVSNPMSMFCNNGYQQSLKPKRGS